MWKTAFLSIKKATRCGILFNTMKTTFEKPTLRKHQAEPPKAVKIEWVIVKGGVPVDVSDREAMHEWLSKNLTNSTPK